MNSPLQVLCRVGLRRSRLTLVKMLHTAISTGRGALFVGPSSFAGRGISGHESAVTAINAAGRSVRRNLDAVEDSVIGE
jgi:hypothetical protein